MSTKLIDRAGMIVDLETMTARAFAFVGDSAGDGRNRALLLGAQCNTLRDELYITEHCADLQAVGLECEIDNLAFRCDRCNRMQAGSSICVMMPTFIVEKNLTRNLLIREIANDDDRIGWCEDCARKVLRKAK